MLFILTAALAIVVYSATGHVSIQERHYDQALLMAPRVPGSIRLGVSHWQEKVQQSLSRAKKVAARRSAADHDQPAIS